MYRNFILLTSSYKYNIAICITKTCCDLIDASYFCHKHASKNDSIYLVLTKMKSGHINGSNLALTFSLKKIKGRNTEDSSLSIK